MASVFEIGLVYKNRHTNCLFLSISEDKLITIKNGIASVVKPHQPEDQSEVCPYYSVKGVTFDDLCEKWGVSDSELDRMTKQHLSVSLEVQSTTQGSKKTPGGRRKTVTSQIEFWRRRRLSTINLK